MWSQQTVCITVKEVKMQEHDIEDQGTSDLITTIVLVGVGVIVAFIVIVMIVKYWRIKPKLTEGEKKMIERRHTLLSGALEKEMRFEEGEEINKERVKEIFGGCIKNNEENYKVMQNIPEKERNKYVEEVSNVFTTAL